MNFGDSLPYLTLKNEKDEDVEVSTLAAEKGVVVFLVPKLICVRSSLEELESGNSC